MHLRHHARGRAIGFALALAAILALPGALHSQAAFLRGDSNRDATQILERIAVEKKTSALRPNDARIFSPVSLNAPAASFFATVFVDARDPPAPFSELQAA